MRARPLNLQLDPASGASLVVQIVEQAKAALRSGELRAGDPMPSTRQLATQLDINRNTVVLAYDELASEGLLTSQHGSGSFVVDPLPPSFQAVERPFEPRQGLGFKVEAPAGSPRPSDTPSAILSIRTGHADPRMLPSLALARAFRRSLKGRDQERLANPERLGSERLRKHILELLVQTAGLHGSLENILLTSGVTAGLRLLAQALIEPGDIVAVEALGSRQHWDVFRQAGAELKPIAVDRYGFQVDDLIEAGPVRAVLLSPRCQYPTTVPLAPERRSRLLAWASAHGVAVLECDAESGLVYDERNAPAPLATEDQHGCVVYLGSFAKTLFPQLSLAYLHAPVSLIAHLAEWFLTAEHSPDPLTDSAVADLFLEGEFHRHLARLRTASLARRDTLAGALKASFGPVLTVEPPAMGMSFWLPVVAGLDIDAWSERCMRKGVAFTKGREYAFDGQSVQALRFGFASHREEELLEIVRRMTQAL